MCAFGRNHYYVIYRDNESPEALHPIARLCPCVMRVGCLPPPFFPFLFSTNNQFGQRSDQTTILKKHEKTFTFQPLYPGAFAIGGVNVSVKADDFTEPSDTKTYPLTISNGNVRIDCKSWADLVTQLASNEKLKSIYWINIDVWDDINIASEDGKLTDWIIGSDAFSGPCSTLVLRINGHTINGNSIIVNKSDLEFRIEDKEYVPVTVSTTAPYKVSNTNSGCLKLTKDIDVYNGATVKVNSGCVLSSGNIPLYAVGDLKGEQQVASKIVVNGGFLMGKEGAIGVQGKGAVVIVGGSEMITQPVLQALDNAVVAGNGSYTEEKRCGGTTITLGNCVLIGNIVSGGYAACGVYHPQKGTLNIGEGAQIIAYSDKVAAAGVVMRGGTLNMTGGTIKADGVANATGKVGDSRVVVPSSGIVFDADANYYDRANVNVKVFSGAINGNHSAVELVNNNNSYTDGQITLTGGTYNSDVAEFAGEGLGLVINSITEKNTFAEGREAVTVDADGVERYYNKLSDALYYAGVGKTTKMLQDVNLVDGTNSYIGIVADGITTLDLNGHKLSSASTTNSVIQLCNHSQLVIEDSQSGGVVETTSANVTPVLFSPGLSDNSCVLTIKGGTFKSQNALFASLWDEARRNSKLIVLDGTFDVKTLTAKWAQGMSCALRGGSYTDALHTSDEARVDNGYEWTKEDGETYPWRVVSGVSVANSKAEYYLDRDENDRYIIDLENVYNEPLTKLTVSKDVENVTVTVRKNFNTANEWNAFYAPFALKVTDELLQKFEIAKIWDTELKWDGETPKTTIEFIKLKSGAEIPAFTPCLILAKEAGVQDITANEVTLGNTNDKRELIDCSTVDQLFTFTGVLERTNIFEKYAVKGGSLRYASDEAAMLSPFKFYMTITDRKTKQEVSGPTQVNIHVIGDETNGINDINDATTRVANGKVYTLQGTLVGTSLQGLPAGIYVQNGRKYVVK